MSVHDAIVVGGAGIPFIKYVEDLRLEGQENVTGVEYRIGKRWRHIDSTHIFLHQGVAPCEMSGYCISGQKLKVICRTAYP